MSFITETNVRGRSSPYIDPGVGLKCGVVVDKTVGAVRCKGVGVLFVVNDGVVLGLKEQKMDFERGGGGVGNDFGR